MPASSLRRCVTAFLLYASLSAAAPAESAEVVAIGHATFVIGDVSARDAEGSSRPLARASEIYNGDVIMTGANAVAQLRFADDSRMVIRRSSEIAIDDFQFGAGKESMVVRLAFGALRSITGLIGRNNKRNVSFRTEVATIGIRGTDFEAVHVPVGRTDLFGAGEKLDPGTYNKVYAGGTQLVSKLGALDLNINEAGFIGLQHGVARTPIRIDQLPPVILKVINTTPQLGKALAPGAEAPPVEGAPLPAESKPRLDAAGNADGTKSSLPPLQPEGNASVKTITTLPVLNTLEPKTLDATKTLSSEPVTTLIAPTTTLKTNTLSTDTTLKLDPSISTTTTLSPTTATKTLSPTTSTILSPTTTTLSPTTSTILAPTTTTLSPTTSTILSPTTTTLSPTTTTTTTKTLSPSTTTILSSPTLSAPLLKK